MHLIIDGYGADPELLQDEGYIYELLNHYPAQLGMSQIAPPSVHRYVGSKAEDWGISGFVLIAESHIAIHTFVERGIINVDVFSCKPFDSAGVLADLKQRFRLCRVESLVLKRGLEYARMEAGHYPLG